MTNEQITRMVEYLRAHIEQHLWECSWCVEREHYCDTMLRLLKLRVKWIRHGLEVIPS